MTSQALALLDGLDDAQRTAARSIDGPVRIIACAGAGKTRTITRRIAYACESGAWDSNRVLAVTFSVKAAQEMRDRLTQLGVGAGVRAATFHSAALRQLKYAWPRICEGEFPYILDRPRDVIAIAIVRATGHEAEPRVVAEIEREINWCKVSLIAAEDYTRVCAATGRAVPAGFEAEQFADIYAQYEIEKTARVTIDFNDILLLTAHMCDQFDDIRDSIRDSIGWLTVDEYQDVSPLQHRLMRAWLGDNRNICVVGDPAQTIYSFAGATSYYLTHFASEFNPITADITLRNDYRSQPAIVRQANMILARSPEREDYIHLDAIREGKTRVTSSIYTTDEQEARQIARRIRKIMQEGGSARDCAVLTRLRAQQTLIVRALQDEGIPYQVRKENGWQQSALTDINLNAISSDSMNAGDDSTQYNEMLFQQGRVTISTIHASKGLEFPHVFLIGCSEGLLPYHAPDHQDNIEEERRLLYVAVTRAEDTLHMSYAQRQDEQLGRARQLSRFLL